MGKPEYPQFEPHAEKMAQVLGSPLYIRGLSKGTFLSLGKIQELLLRM